MEQWKAVPCTQVLIKDDFWDKYIRLVTEEILPYQWEALNDRVEGAEPSHCISNFEVAAGRKKGTFEGAVFQDTDLAKWLEAAAYSLAYEKNEELEQTADAMIELIGEAQLPDGYINTHWSILAPEKRWHNLREGHELYTAGHFMEAACAYYQVTGKRRFLDMMCRFADLICQVFHMKEWERAVPGHQEVEIGLIKLYHATGEEKYLFMAKDFIDRRGTEPNYLLYEHENLLWMDIFHDVNPFFPEYSQCHKPVREQKTAEGHAVRAVYMYSAMADLAAAYDDEKLLSACQALYRNITEKRMYITGGIGSSGAYERFTVDYDLPNDRNYSESCASIGLAMFCRRMVQITREARYADTMETALYNTVLAGIALDGKHFFYVNPLETWGPDCMEHTSMAHVKPQRQQWYGVACCPPNIARTLASLSEYIYMNGKNALYVNLYLSGAAETEISGIPVSVRQSTSFPFYGEIELELSAKEPVWGTLGFRIPGYAKHFRIFADGGEITADAAAEAENSDGKEPDASAAAAVKKTFQGRKEKGYFLLEGLWSSQKVRIEFSMPAKFVHANPKVRADAGKVAMVKGPLVYCLEETDNGGNLACIYADTSKKLEEVYEPELLGGTMTLRAKGKRLNYPELSDDKLYQESSVRLEEVTLKAVPYCYWGNRAAGEMMVWIKEYLQG